MTDVQLDREIELLLKNNPNRKKKQRRNKHKMKDCIKSNKRGDYYFSDMNKYQPDEQMLKEHLSSLCCELEVKPFKHYYGSTEKMIPAKLLKCWYGVKSFTQEWFLQWLSNPNVYGLYETGYEYTLKVKSNKNNNLYVEYKWKEKGKKVCSFSCSLDEYEKYAMQLDVSIEQIKNDFVRLNRYKVKKKTENKKLQHYEEVQDKYFNQSRCFSKMEKLSKNKTVINRVLKECALYKEDNDLLSAKKDVFPVEKWTYVY